MFVRIALLILIALPSPVALAASQDEATAKARQMIAELGAGLKGRLGEAMKAGGPASAISVCKEIGQTMAEEVSQKHGAFIHRVSLKPRNVADTPNSLEAHLLKTMSADQAEGALKPLYQAGFSRDGQRYLLTMKPVVTAKVCLHCHGPKETLTPEVKGALAANYPDDIATGYAVGDVRGAFSVASPL